MPTYQAFTATDLLGQLALERVLAKLSTRRYRVGLLRMSRGRGRAGHQR
jgi:putative transposase